MQSSVLFVAMFAQGNVKNGKFVAAWLLGFAKIHYIDCWVSGRQRFEECTLEEKVERSKVPFEIFGVVFHSCDEAKRVIERFKAECGERIFENEEQVGKALKDIMADSI